MVFVTVPGFTVYVYEAKQSELDVCESKPKASIKCLPLPGPRFPFSGPNSLRIGQLCANLLAQLGYIMLD